MVVAVHMKMIRGVVDGGGAADGHGDGSSG